jgi:hypothetical protein
MKTLKRFWLWFVEFFRGPQGPQGERGYTPSRGQVTDLIRSVLRDKAQEDARSPFAGTWVVDDYQERCRSLDGALKEALAERSLRRPVLEAHCHPSPTVTKGKKFTLPTDSAERKEVPLLRGCFRYFPAALAGVAAVSKRGNDKHNPGEELHHARGKSSDHGDCLLRHLMDAQDLLAAGGSKAAILTEVDQIAWRALAYSQELHERLEKSPLAPGARLPK